MQETPTVASLLENLRDPSWEVRQEASRRLRDVSDESSLEELLAASGDEDLDVRIAVVEALKNFGDRRAEEALLGALFDEEWEVKWAALRSLGSIWEDTDIKKMGSKLPEKRVVGIESISKKKSTRYLRPLLAVLDDEEEVQIASIRAISYLGDPRAIDQLKEARVGGSRDVMAWTEEALLRLGDVETIRQKAKGLKELIPCHECGQKLPISSLYKVGSRKLPEARYLCRFHFEQYQEQVEPFEGKLKLCKLSKVHWPKVDLVEGMSPPVRHKRYFSFGPAPEGQFYCYYSQKLRYNRDLSPLKLEGEPLCHRSAYQIANQSANSPFMTVFAIEFRKDAFDEGYLLCERCRVFQPLADIVVGEDYRDECLCTQCHARMN